MGVKGGCWILSQQGPLLTGHESITGPHRGSVKSPSHSHARSSFRITNDHQNTCFWTVWPTKTCKRTWKGHRKAHAVTVQTTGPPCCPTSETKSAATFTPSVTRGSDFVGIFFDSSRSWLQVSSVSHHTYMWTQPSSETARAPDMVWYVSCINNNAKMSYLLIHIYVGNLM